MKKSPQFNYYQYMGAHAREYTRLILSSFGTPLSSPDLTPYQRARGLLFSFIGHGSLSFHSNILHGDLSAWNTIYTSQPTAISSDLLDISSPLTQLHGFIFDLDYAISIEPHTGGPAAQVSGAIHRTGTLPFMAIGILLKELHCYRHNLKSFFYLLLYLALSTQELCTNGLARFFDA